MRVQLDAPLPRRAKKRKKKAEPLSGPVMGLVIAFVCLLLVVPVLAFYRYYVAPVAARDAFKPGEFAVVAHQIILGSLVPDANGVVALPSDMSDLTADGKVYVTRRGNGLTLVLFPTTIDERQNLRGYLFSSRPMITSDTHRELRTRTQKTVDILLPAPRNAPVPTQRREVILGEKQNRYWRAVSRTVDQ